MKIIIKVIFKAIKILINAVLLPLNLLINSMMPDVADAISSINGFFSYITDACLWVKSWLPFYDWIWTLLVSVLIFKISVPAVAHIIKLVLAWYDKLKP